VLKQRLVACLLIREGLIVQSLGFRRYLPIGQPRFPIEFVSRWDVDEIVLLDMSAGPQGRLADTRALEALSRSCYVPLTVGGGIRNVDEVRRIIRAGADKASINTHALARPQLITEIADTFGVQCVVVSIDCRKELGGSYQVYAASGMRPTGRTPASWAVEAEERGAGEIFLNSIDCDGARAGYDIALIQEVTQVVSIPVIACGGVGTYSHFAAAILQGGASAAAAANIFHHHEHSTILAKAHLLKAGVNVRLDSAAQYQDREFDDIGRLLMISAERLADLEFRRSTAERL
jgi:cyclase